MRPCHAKFPHVGLRVEWGCRSFRYESCSSWIDQQDDGAGGREGVFREVAFCAAVFGHLEKASLHASAIEEKEAKQSRRKREGGGE